MIQDWYHSSRSFKASGQIIEFHFISRLSNKFEDKSNIYSLMHKFPWFFCFVLTIFKKELMEAPCNTLWDYIIYSLIVEGVWQKWVKLLI